MLLYRSPAKINLSLDILARRKDGYHQLHSVAHCIGLYDVLKFEFLWDEKPLLQFRCNQKNLETDDNLCLRAVREYIKAWELETGLRGWRGVRITLQKNIPIGAGLGGGSSDAATVLLALSQRFERSLDETQLHLVAAKLGADVPLFLKGGCVLMEGVGDKLSTLPSLEGAVVLVCPTQHASTPDVYRAWDEIAASAIPAAHSFDAPLSQTKNWNPFARKNRAPVNDKMLEAVRARDLKTVARNLKNDLTRAARSCGVDVEIPISLLKKHGALGASLTGSGAASFGLFENLGAAQHAAQNISKDAAWPRDYQIFAAPLLCGGVEKVKVEMIKHGDQKPTVKSRLVE